MIPNALLEVNEIIIALVLDRHASLATVVALLHRGDRQRTQLVGTGVGLRVAHETGPIKLGLATSPSRTLVICELAQATYRRCDRSNVRGRCHGSSGWDNDCGKGLDSRRGAWYRRREHAIQYAAQERVKAMRLDPIDLSFFDDYGRLDRVVSYRFRVNDSGSFDLLER
jgi:hypothetical protein